MLESVKLSLVSDDGVGGGSGRGGGTGGLATEASDGRDVSPLLSLLLLFEAELLSELELMSESAVNVGVGD